MDIERLKADPAYWDEVAPEGATHYTPRGPDVCWFRHDGEGWRTWIDGRWGVAYGSEGFFESLIPRPTQWRGPEDGLPPVGTVCESANHRAGGGAWVKCTVVAHLQEGVDTDVVFQTGVGWDWHSEPTNFRPLKSDKERAVEAALAQDCGPNDWMLSRLEFCTRLYDAGLLRLPEGAD